MKVIHSEIRDERHLQGLTEEEKNFIRRLAKIYVNTIIKMHEDSIRVCPDIGRGSK